MKKHIFLPLYLCLYCLISISQITPASQWKWVTGDSLIQAHGAYGTKGNASPANTPGARDGAISWKDPSGNFWLFGGQGYGGSLVGYLNDLWKFDLVSQQWTWFNGDSIPEQKGVYGTQGVAALTNKPGGRTGSVSWVDPSGNLWLFGGSGYAASGSGILNDLWRYDPLTSQWTWMKGDSIGSVAGVYGSKGVANAANKPGTRFGSVSWTDNSGNLWLLGGRGYATFAGGLFGNLNDLWKYDPIINQWTWMNGDNSTNVAGVYGTQGTPSAFNKPGGRFESASWNDASGNFWLFGGESYLPVSSRFNSFDDLWKYDVSTNQWTWMNGHSSPNVTPTFGLQGVSDPGNNPGARYSSVSWIDLQGKMWLFGGFFFFDTGGGSSGSGIFDDVWKFDPATNQWTWVKGDNNMNSNFGIYGNKNVASPANKPGSRYNGVSWVDASGNLWLFGGFGAAVSSYSDRLNDLWTLSVPGVVPIVLLNISAQSVQKTIRVDWQTSQEINSSHFVVERSIDGISFSPIGYVIAAGNSYNQKNYSFTDQQPFTGINYYRVKLIDRDAAFKYSLIVKAAQAVSENGISVFPNPVVNVATINLSATINAELKLSLYEATGKVIINRQIAIPVGNNSFTVDMSKLAKGVYSAVVSWGNEIRQCKIIKE